MKKKVIVAASIIGGITAVTGTILGVKKKKKYAEQ